ncbi:MAG: hypothetical protein WCS42_23925 [Verrucomicrobiota bacterium]
MARLQLPIPKIINGVVNGITVANTICSFDLIPNKCATGVLVTATVTVNAYTAATKSVPTLAMAIGESRFIVGSSNQRRRTIAQLFGAQGLNALNDAKNGGWVQYFQAGAAITAAVNGITYGATPVLIGSAADVAIQAALANSTATVGKFYLPFIFAEDYRKDVANAEAMALPTAYGDGKGNVTGTIGSVFFQLDIPPVPVLTGAVLGGCSSVAITAVEEFDDRLLAGGATVQLSKEKIYQDTYTIGDVELADQFTNKDRIQRVSLLTISDPISKVVVKQGERLLKQVTFEENMIDLAKAGFNVGAIPRNRFDIEFDINDDPNTSLPIDPTAKLSIIATFTSMLDAAKQVTILPSFYGPVE